MTWAFSAMQTGFSPPRTGSTNGFRRGSGCCTGQSGRAGRCWLDARRRSSRGAGQRVSAFDLRNFWGGTISVDHSSHRTIRKCCAEGHRCCCRRAATALPQRSSPIRKRWLLTPAHARSEVATSSHSVTVAPEISAFVTDRLQLGVTPSFGSAAAGWQYVAQPTDASGRTRYLLGALKQHTASLTSRGTYAFSQHLTLQAYAQAFGSGGTYDAFREVVNARASLAGDRVATLSPSRVRFDHATSRFSIDDGTHAVHLSRSGILATRPSERPASLRVFAGLDVLPGLDAAALRQRS